MSSERHRFAASWVAIAFLAGLAGLSRDAAARPDPAPAPTRDVERALEAFNAALAAGNAATLRDLAGAGFALVEGGRVYDTASMIDAVRTALAAGKMRRVPSGFATTTRGNVAWSRYRVTGEFKGTDGIVPLAFQETAVLERIGGRWRVVLLTSMPEAGGQR